MQPDDALFCFARAHQKYVRPASGTAGSDFQLVGRDNGDATPREKWASEHLDRWWRNTAARALAAECGNSCGMCQEERRLFPNAKNQLIHVVWSRRAGT